MSRILTGLKPTNILHLGNYFGAIEPFIKQQAHGDENLLFVADYHSITVPQEPADLREHIKFAVAVYLACGVDPEKIILFQQSHVQEHTELGWVLSCVATMGEAERMTQYKDKARVKGESVSVGLFTYPILMAADILLYDTQIVPVGEDQKQHVELARDLAERFNNRFGYTFVVPKPQIRESGARIMGLDDPEKKMSKSAASEKNYISLMDDAETVLKKVKSAVTDSEGIVVFREHKKGIVNLMTLYSLLTGLSFKEIEGVFEGKGYGDFKVAVAEEVTTFLTPLQKKITSYLENEDLLNQVLASGAEKARVIAQKKMTEVRKKIGIAA